MKVKFTVGTNRVGSGISEEVEIDDLDLPEDEQARMREIEAEMVTWAHQNIDMDLEIIEDWKPSEEEE